MIIICRLKSLFWAFCAGVLLNPGLSTAQDHITQRAWLEDATSQMTWQEAQQAPVQSYTGTLSKGFGDSAIWLRLRIDPERTSSSSQTSDQLILRIRPVYLDDIQVFDSLAPHGLAGQAGDIHHPRDDKLQSLSFLVPIARGEQPRDIWVRLVSTSTRQIDVQAMNIDELNRRALTHSLVFSVYVGLITVLAVWGLVYWVLSRDATVGAFGVMQIGALLFALASLGYLRALWPQALPAWLLDQSTSVFSITAVSAAIWFHVLLIREFQPPRWVNRVHIAMLALLPLKLLILALGWPILALRLNMYEVLLAPLVFLFSVVAAQGWKALSASRPTLSRPVVIGFYAFLMAMLLGASLPAMGIVNANEIGLYIVQMHGLVTAFLVLLMLQYRSHVIQKQQRETALALERSKLEIVQERTIREEQENLLAMLAHELKTPLATMQLRLDNSSSGSRQIRQSIRDMNGVIERCQQTLQLSNRLMAPQLAAVDMTDIVREAASSCAQPERVVSDMPQQLPLVTDRQLWFIVLNNLLENACKYAAPNSPIDLKLETLHDASGPAKLQLTVSNHPAQASWPDPEKIFEKYYRSPQARRQAGTGLGLYLVRNLMRVIGGHIDYAPTADRVRFVLQLPLDAASQRAV